MLSFLKRGRKKQEEQIYATGICFIDKNGQASGIAKAMDKEAEFRQITKKCMVSVSEDSETFSTLFQGKQQEFQCVVVSRSKHSMALEYYGEEADDFFQSLLAKGRSCFDCGSTKHLRQCPKCSGTNTMCARCLQSDLMCRDCRSTELIFKSRQLNDKKKKQKKRNMQNTVEITKTKAWKKLRKSLL